MLEHSEHYCASYPNHVRRDNAKLTFNDLRGEAVRTHEVCYSCGRLSSSCQSALTKNVPSGVVYLAHVELCVNVCVLKMQPSSVRNCASVS